MGIWDEVEVHTENGGEWLQVKATLTPSLHQYRIGDPIALSDGCYICREGSFIVANGQIVASTPHLFDKWGNSLDHDAVLHPTDDVAKAIDEISRKHLSSAPRDTDTETRAEIAQNVESGVESKETKVALTLRSNPAIHGGAWCIDGTRIQVEHLQICIQGDAPLVFMGHGVANLAYLFEQYPSLIGKINIVED